MNLWDILIIAVVLAAVVLAFRSTRRRSRGSCGCGCDNCTMNCSKQDKPSGSGAGQA